MSTIKTKKVQVGTDSTASNNFTIYTPGTPDGTVRIGNGNADSPTDRVTVTSAGNVGIGTTSPSSILDVRAASGVSMFRLTATTGTNSVYSRYSNTGGYLYLGRDNSSGTDFGSAYAAGIWSTGAYPMLFGTNGSERMRIDTSGRVTMPHQPHIMGSPTNTSGAGLANSFATTTSQGGLTFANSRITVPVTGIYLITFNTICDNTTGRVDAKVWINGGEKFNTLSEDNGQGHHYRGVSNAILLQANDYIQFDNNDWYDGSNTGATQWRTASVTLIG